MESSDLVALAGIVVGALGALTGALLAARSHRATAFSEQTYEFRVNAFAECARELHALLRVTYDRTRRRLQGRAQSEREPVREGYYLQKAVVDGMIARVRLLSSSTSISVQLQEVRDLISDLTTVHDEEELLRNRRRIQAAINDFLDQARVDLPAR